MKRFDRPIYKFALVLLALQGTLLAADVVLSPQENYFLRRIHEFWKDKDYSLVKSQIADFLAQNPNTQVKDQLQAILGDLYFQESLYAEALACYQKITSPELREKTLYKHVISLRAEARVDELLALGLPYYEGAKRAKCDFSEEVQLILGETLFQKMSESTDLENKRHAATGAKALFSGLSSESYKVKALSPLAKIHEVLGEYPQAYSLYVILAEKFPQQKEELLFQAASIQLSYDKVAAALTYGQIIKMQGSLASTAAYNELVLLFQEKNYDHLIERHAVLEQVIASDQKPIYLFCLGRAYFEVEKYTDASRLLEQFLALENQNPAYRRAAFMTVFSCAEKKSDLALFDRGLDLFLKSFATDAEAPKILLSHFNLALKEDRKQEALQDLKQLLTNYPTFEQKETALYNYALLLFKAQNWAESRVAFSSLQKEFPSSSLSTEVPGYILHCSIERSRQEKSEEAKELLALDLGQALSKSFFSADDKPIYHVLLIKTQMDLKKYSDALSSAEHFLADYALHPSAGEVHLLASYAADKIQGAEDRFLEHAEQALRLNTAIKDLDDLHLRLFNTYLKRENFEAAANHLFYVFTNSGRDLQLQNLLWLSNYYYTQQENQKALTLYQKLLGIKDNQIEPAASLDKSILEVEALKYASLLESHSKIEFLSSLTALQANHPNAGWKLQRQALFDLAMTHKSVGHNKKALSLFDTLIATTGSAPSYFSQAAKLEKARLLFSMTTPAEITESNPTVVEVLSLLKDLQIQKKVYSEPIHMEAGFDYTDLRTKLASEEKRAEVTLFFLNRLRENFSNESDLISRDYHEGLSKQSDKQKLYQCYLECLNAEISFQETLMAKNSNDWDNVRAVFEKILQNENATAYLKHRIEDKLKSIP